GGRVRAGRRADVPAAGAELGGRGGAGHAGGGRQPPLRPRPAAPVLHRQAPAVTALLRPLVGQASSPVLFWQGRARTPVLRDDTARPSPGACAGTRPPGRQPFAAGRRRSFGPASRPRPCRPRARPLPPGRGQGSPRLPFRISSFDYNVMNYL